MWPTEQHDTKGSAAQLPSPSLKEVCVFLSDYAACLLGCGATCIRIEKNVERMACALGIHPEMSIMPSHILLTVWDECRSESYCNICRVHHLGISFHINTLLSKLSWEVADGKRDFADAVQTFRSIVTTPVANKWLVLLLTSFANASFCRLFGGDGIAMLMVWMATLAGYWVKQLLLENRIDVRFVFFCSAFCSSVIAAGGHVFHWGNTPEVAVGTSVLYLIPGIPYINSMSDMLDGHYLCAFSRFMNAAVLTACLSAGLCGGLLLMDLNWI